MVSLVLPIDFLTMFFTTGRPYRLVRFVDRLPEGRRCMVRLVLPIDFSTMFFMMTGLPYRLVRFVDGCAPSLLRSLTGITLFSAD